MINITDVLLNKYYSFIDGIRNKISLGVAVCTNMGAPIVLAKAMEKTSAFILNKFYPTFREVEPFKSARAWGFLGSVILFNQWTNIFLKKEINKLLSHPQPHIKKALIIETADWSAGDEPKNIIQRVASWIYGDITLCTYWLNLLQLSKTHSIEHIKPHSEKHLCKQLDLLQNNTIDLVWIIGHGNSQSIALNHKFCIDKTSRCIEKIAQKLKTIASCILFSCCTGKGKSNIARKLSNTFANTVVYAPKEEVLIACFEFTPELFPLYYRKFGITADTRAYYNGTRIKAETKGKAQDSCSIRHAEAF